MENQNDRQIAENESSPGLFLPGEFSGFRVFFWYSFVYLAFSMLASIIMNGSVSEGTTVLIFGYVNSLCFGFAFFFENRFRWFKGNVRSVLFIICLVLWAFISMILALIFFLNTVFIGGLH
ncbi:MAG: hypothetical protein AB1403_00820 [Candidatus Riflebacteria bacterium]